MANKTQPARDFFQEATAASNEGDHPRAYQLFVQAARAGELRAFNKVGQCLAQGMGVPRDPALAYVWYRKGANKRDPAAYVSLAKLFRAKGDVRRSRFWFDKALAHGDARAAYELAKIHIATPTPASLRRARELLIAACASMRPDDELREDAKRLLALVRRETRGEPKFSAPDVEPEEAPPSPRRRRKTVVSEDES